MTMDCAEHCPFCNSSRLRVNFHFTAEAEQLEITCDDCGAVCLADVACERQQSQAAQSEST